MYDVIRKAGIELRRKLAHFPAVAILGPRQCGKTTLVKQSLQNWRYLDMERPSDARPLQSDAEARLRQLGNHIILDEAQTLPSLFPVLRALIDEDRKTNGRYVLLGSASPELIKGLSESLAGRIAFVELTPFQYNEIADEGDAGRSLDHFWLRGGFPDAFLQNDARIRQDWFEAYQKTFLERDLHLLQTGANPALLGKLWALFAHVHGGIWNASSFSAALGISYHTVNRYADILEGSFLIRRLQPYYANLGKRLVKSPKLYLRDTGLLHHFLGIQDQNTLDVHPSRGASWESMIVEGLIAKWKESDASARFFYWRTAAGAEVDLLVESKGELHPYEIKIHSSPVLNDVRGLVACMEDLKLHSGFVVCNCLDEYSMGKGINAIPVRKILSYHSVGE